MKSLVFSLLAAVSFAAFAADPVPQRVTETIELFNGKNLDGWYTWLRNRGKNADPNGVFSVKDGVMHFTGQEWGALVTEKAYRDYHLIVEYRFCGRGWGPREKDAADSGILFHSTGADGICSGAWMASYECNILQSRTGYLIIVGDKSRPDLYTCEARVDSNGRWHPNAPEKKFRGKGGVMSIAPHVPWTGDLTAVSPPENPIGEWNKLEIVCDGDEATYVFNNSVIMMLDNLKPEGGRIQLQTEGHGIEFRRVTLKPLAK